MKDATRQRRELIKMWDESRDNVQKSETMDEYLFASGKLTAASILLNRLRHNGDGSEPIIKSGEWEQKAYIIIAQHPLNGGRG